MAGGEPTVGVPLFLSAVAVGSFAVHVAVLSNTTWVSDFLSGKELGSSEAETAMVVEPGAGNTVATLPAGMDLDGAESFVVILPDGTKARAYVEPPTEVALLPGPGDSAPDR